MNKFYLWALCLMTAVMTSCQFSENIYINEDGSGKMSFAFDASELMMMAGDEMAKEGEERIDSVLVFKDFLDEKRDSISKLPAADQAKLKALENYKMHMLMDPETKEMVMDLSTDFKSVDELQNMMNAMNNVGNLQGEGGASEKASNNPFAALNKEGVTEMSYSFKKNVFKRTAKVVDAAAYKMMTDSLSQMSMMFGSSKYKLNYHFPKKIKSVSNDQAMFSQDGKSFTLEFGFMDYIADPTIMNLEVVLED